MESSEEFIRAISNGDLVSVKSMVEQNLNLVNAQDENNIPVVMLALYYEQPGIADFLVASGAKMDIFNTSALGLTYVIKNLVAKYPKLVHAVSIDGYQPLGLACLFGRMDAVRFLIENRADVNFPSVNEQKVTPLHSAVTGGHKDIVRILIAHGADVNITQQFDLTPLHAAAQSGHVEIVKLLLENGADKGMVSKDGKKAVDFAREKGHQEIVTLLS
jgi:ankyrin repeat protein